MKNKNIAIAVLSLILLFIACMTWEYYNINKVKEDLKLRDKLIGVVKVSEQIEISKVTDFDWDKLYVFTPHAEASKVLRSDNITNSNFTYNIEHDDTINMIAFIKDNKLVSYRNISRSDFEFEYMEGYKVSKDKAIFDVEKEGSTFLSLKK